MKASYKKLPEITHLFSFAIILVVFGHCYVEKNLYEFPFYFRFLRQVIYSFHVPLFVFISGFLFAHTNINKEKLLFFKFIKKKFKRILVPYSIFISLYYLPRACLSKYFATKYPVDVISFLKAFIHPYYCPIHYYWFLITIFIIFLFSKIFFYIIKNNHIYLVVPFTIFLIILHSNPLNIKYFYVHKVSELMIFFWLGCLFYDYKDKVNILNNKYIFIVLLLNLAIINIPHLNFVSISIIKPLTGILFSYSFIIIYKEKKLRLFKYIDGFHYQIYLLSWFFDRIILFISLEIMGLESYIVFPLLFFSTLVFPIVISKFIIYKLPQCKFMIGL